MHSLFVLGQILRCNAIIELVCISKTFSENLIEVPEWISRRLSTEPQAHHLASSGRYIEDVMHRRLGPHFRRIHRIPISRYNILVETVLHERRRVWLPPQALVVRLVVGE